MFICQTERVWQPSFFVFFPYRLFLFYFYELRNLLLLFYRSSLLAVILEGDNDFDYLIYI